MRPFGIAAAQRRLIVAACASHSALATSLIVATRPYVALAAAGPWSEATGASSPLRSIASARSVSASAADRSPGCAGLPMVRLGCSVCRRHSGDSMGGIELVLVSQRGIRTLCIGRLTLLTGRLTAVAVVGASRALVAPPSSCDVLQAAGCGGGGLDWLTGLMAAVSLPSGSSAWRCEQHRIGIWREDGGSMLFWQRVGLTEKALHFLTLPPAPTAQCAPPRSQKTELLYFSTF